MLCFLSGSPDKAGKADALKKTLQVSNLSPILTVEQLKQLFSFCGTVVECTITDSKHFAYIEYSKPEEATAALAMNNMDVGGRPLNVEMAKSVPQKPALLNSPLASSSLPMMMQQAVAMQQMQFQQALLMQQTMNAQQAANRAATMKSATELAASRAAEISRKLKADGHFIEEKETDRKSRCVTFSKFLREVYHLLYIISTAFSNIRLVNHETLKLLEIPQLVHNGFMNFVILNFLNLQFSNLKKHCVGYVIHRFVRMQRFYQIDFFIFCGVGGLCFLNELES